ncbi:hypothetical protein F5X68DRAFT_232715 [Plectosphaerella plurivora]|uniref:Cyanovirin-N domain-containing protein n=1 Tax=Plectosphaerella plurivora TaxID=936078 RepID=A0A9P8VA12_9PEZI|nr:hypothetical protein F5X68DRAFT_232715 [Plectosphaerella plurivora]
MVPGPIRMMLIIMMTLLRNTFLTSIFPEETICPMTGCFQKRCWDINLVEGHLLTAVCVPENNSRDQMMVNTLDLNLCVGISDDKLKWQNNGNFADSAEFMAITRGDQFMAAGHIALNAYCPDAYGPRYNCKLDLSELVWLDQAQIGCFFNRAIAQKPPEFHQDAPPSAMGPVRVRYDDVVFIGYLEEQGIAYMRVAANATDYQYYM